MKNAVITQTGAPKEGELEKINALTRRPFSAEEVYTFSVTLCDNDIDRDFERFTVNALNTLAEMYVGKTGIFDHSMRGKDQVARIFSCEVKTKEGVFTRDGQPYTYLAARAYMPKTAKNEELILDIDAGINKEVSVGCAMASSVCSVCGTDRRLGCTHKAGRHYKKDGKKVLCHTVLDQPTDAYEWSFVAIPAQPKAGVTKGFTAHFGNTEDSLRLVKTLASALSLKETEGDTEALEDNVIKAVKELNVFARKGKEYIEEVKKRTVTDLNTLCGDLPAEVVKNMLAALSADELSEFAAAVHKSALKGALPRPQTAAVPTDKKNSGNNYNFIV